VNDLLWHEVPTLFGRASHERIYVTRTDDQGRTTVMFGDGRTGARLPTGQENVRAQYRKGIGSGGNLGRDRLTQLLGPTIGGMFGPGQLPSLTRSLGVKGVTNPLPAAGGANRETLSDARTNAPLAVLTLDRIVSLRDYQDFARAFAGIAKALATWTWSGSVRGVFITVAGPGGAAVDQGSPLYDHLLAAILSAGDPTVPFSVGSYAPRFFRVSAGLKIDDDYIPDHVVTAVEQELRKRFSFDAREFGQPVSRSEVTTVMQSVSGVVAVDLDELYRSDATSDLNELLEAKAPAAGSEKVFGAELLTLDQRPVKLTVLS